MHAPLDLNAAELSNLITACRTSAMRAGCIPWQVELDSISEKLCAARAVLDTLDCTAPNPNASPAKGMNMARKRFEYQRMTGEELRNDLQAIGMPISAFARITGSIADRVQKWVNGDEDIPTWVPILTAILRNVPGALPEARQVAAERIIRDLDRPQRGEFPYLQRESIDDDD